MGFRAVYQRFLKNLRNERVTQIVDKRKMYKEHTFLKLLYVSCIYFTNLKVLQNSFGGVKFREKFEVLLQKQFLSVLACFQNQLNRTFLL